MKYTGTPVGPSCPGNAPCHTRAVLRPVTNGTDKSVITSVRGNSLSRTVWYSGMTSRTSCPRQLIPETEQPSYRRGHQYERRESLQQSQTRLANALPRLIPFPGLPPPTLLLFCRCGRRCELLTPPG